MTRFMLSIIFMNIMYNIANQEHNCLTTSECNIFKAKYIEYDHLDDCEFYFADVKNCIVYCPEMCNELPVFSQKPNYHYKPKNQTNFNILRSPPKISCNDLALTLKTIFR